MTTSSGAGTPALISVKLTAAHPRGMSGPADGGLRRGDACNLDPERRAAHVVEPGRVAEADRVRVAAMLPADTNLEPGVGGAAAFHGHPDQLADALLVDTRKRGPLDDPAVGVERHDAALDVVAREAERGLRQVVGSEREEVSVLRDLAGH